MEMDDFRFKEEVPDMFPESGNRLNAMDRKFESKEIPMLFYWRYKTEKIERCYCIRSMKTRRAEKCC